MRFSTTLSTPAAILAGLSLFHGALAQEHDITLCWPNSDHAKKGDYAYVSVDNLCWDRPDSECIKACVTFLNRPNTCTYKIEDFHHQVPNIGILLGQQVTKDGFFETTSRAPWNAFFDQFTTAIPWQGIEEIWYNAVVHFGESDERFVPDQIEFKVVGDYGYEFITMTCRD